VSRTLLHRPARVWPQAVPTDDIVVQPPPPRGEPPANQLWLQLLFPLIAGFGSVMFVLFNPQPVFIFIGGAMAIGSVGLGVGIYAQQRSALRHRQRIERERYQRYIRSLVREAKRTARLQDDAGRFIHPDAVGLWAIACQRVRVWERRPGHDDFASARIGQGSVPLATRLVLDPQHDPLADRDPTLLAAAEAVTARHGVVPDQPIVLDLRTHPAVSLIGPGTATRPLARTVVAEWATFCSPDDLLVAVCYPPEAAAAWEFAKWLPHTDLDGVALLCDDGARLAELLAGEVAGRRERARRRTGLLLDDRKDDESQRHLLVIVDGFSASSAVARLDMLTELAERAGEMASSVVFLVESQRDEPPAVDVRVHAHTNGTFLVEGAYGGRLAGRSDGTDPLLVEAIARQVCPLRLGDRETRVALTETCRLVDLLGATSARDLDPVALWLSRPGRDTLRVPIGMNADGRPECLDLKEAGLGGMGPHGLLVGATGSGKSELLRTLVTALALTHPPDELGFVLVDFKGGAAFAGLAGLPHVAGMITNLADDLAMVDRMYAALFGEQQRRQRLLRKAGNLDSVREYQRRRAAGQLPDAEPLPYLLIVVDEFGELLASRPDFIDLFVAIGRVGRSLGMHLLLASQRLEEGRLRGLESHLSYRICLRTFSGMESQAAIGTQDAYHLPPVPGSAYLKVDTTIYERFKCALASGPDRLPGERTTVDAAPALFTMGAASAPAAESGPTAPDGRSDADGDEDGNRPTEMAVAIERICETGASPVHQVWLPPLIAELPLDRLLPECGWHPVRGLQALGWRQLGSLSVPIGLIDLPESQAQSLHLLDFTGPGGHLVVVGAPQTGKSTLLRTLLVTLVVTHTPDEVHVYAIDYGGGSLFALRGAPHVGDVCGRLEPDKVRRTINDVWSLIDEREARFRDSGVDSPATLRQRRADGSLPAGDYSDVLLLIDGWGPVREEIGDLEDEILDIAARGLRVGVHLVLTANRWYEVRANLRDNIGGRLELRLNEPAESEIDRRAAAGIPVGAPGRALTADRHHLQVALPALGGSVEELAEAAARGWRGHPAPLVRLLPPLVTIDSLPGPGRDTAEGVPVGIDEFELAPVYLDIDGSDPHFLVLGDSESGKTTFLRSLIAAIQARKGADRAMFLVIDYRRTLLDAVRPEHLWAYCGAAQAVVPAVNELTEGIVERLPPFDLAPGAIAKRNWWTGPDIYVVADDYDLVATQSNNPVLPLVDLLPQGRDIGLHVILARRVGGMARSGFDPLLSRVRELHSPGLILSGDPGEGPLIGTHRATGQPAGRGLLIRRKQRPLLVQTVDVTAPTLAERAAS